MILNRCRVCGCPTDPAESVCDDCREESEQKERFTAHKTVVFKLQRILEGSGMWSYGGFDTGKQRGQFLLPVSPEGETLREVARLREENGRHTLSIVYPGCYVVHAICPQAPEIYVYVYKMKEIDRQREEGIAVPWSLRNQEPDITRMLQPAIEIARSECILPRNRSNHYFWRLPDALSC